MTEEEIEFQLQLLKDEDHKIHEAAQAAYLIVNQKREILNQAFLRLSPFQKGDSVRVHKAFKVKTEDVECLIEDVYRGFPPHKYMYRLSRLDSGRPYDIRNVKRIELISKAVNIN
ncbi:hypothetical protein [Spirosoma migulaei]